jgi:hypothetical protein
MPEQVGPSSSQALITVPNIWAHSFEFLCVVGRVLIQVGLARVVGREQEGTLGERLGVARSATFALLRFLAHEILHTLHRRHVQDPIGHLDSDLGLVEPIHEQMRVRRMLRPERDL